MQHGVASSVSDTTRAMSLTSTSIVQTLATKRTLVDLAIVHAAERHAVVLQL